MRVPDRVEPVSENDSRVAMDEGRHSGVDFLAPLDVVGAKANDHDCAQLTANPQLAHDAQPGRHLPARPGVDVDAWQDRLECHGRRRHDRIAYRSDFRPWDLALDGSRRRSCRRPHTRLGRDRAGGRADALTNDDLPFHAR